MTDTTAIDADMLEVLQCMALRVIKPARVPELKKDGYTEDVHFRSAIAPHPCMQASLHGRAFFPAYVNHAQVASVLKYMVFYGLKNATVAELQAAATDVLYTPCACGAPSLIEKIMKHESQFDIACHVFIHGFPAHTYSYMYDAYVMMLYCHVPAVQ